MTQFGLHQSPCIKLCVLDPETNTCAGCYRTIREITEWVSYADEERAAILHALPARRAAYALRARCTYEVPQGPRGRIRACAVCQGAFACCAETPERQCWCESLPHITPPGPSGDQCLCPDCLSKAILMAP